MSRSYRSVDAERGVGRQAFGSRFPPLGLLNLAASLRADTNRLRRKIGVHIFDEEACRDARDLETQVNDWLGRAEGPTMIGATSYTSTLPELEQFLGRFDPARHLIIVGGAHVTVQPKFDHAHILVRGEGRDALRNIVNTIGTSEFASVSGTCGIVLETDSSAARPSKPAYDDSLVTLPSPPFAYDLVSDSHQEFTTHVERAICDRPQIYVCTQSCRARCSFCSTYLIHGRSKSRPAALVKEDLAYLVDQFGHDGFEFWDDDLLQHTELDTLFSVLRELGKPWFCFGRVETITRRRAEKLAEAGCRRIFLGVESMDQERLDYFNKKTTVADNERAVEALDAAGIGVIAGFILGHPDDTVEGILGMHELYQRLPLLAISTSVLAPDPGTREFSRARQRGGVFLDVLGPDGREIKPDLERFGVSAPAGLPTLSTSVSKEELNALAELIEADLYLRDETYHKFLRTIPTGQLGRLADYLRYMHDRTLRTLDRRMHPSVHQLRDEILTRPFPLPVMVGTLPESGEREQ